MSTFMGMIFLKMRKATNFQIKKECVAFNADFSPFSFDVKI